MTNSQTHNPNPDTWTNIGRQILHVEAEEPRFNPYYLQAPWDDKEAKTGSSDVGVTLYRLNSTDAFDYFLVRLFWTVTPNNKREDAGGVWFYNRDHKLGVNLEVLTPSTTIQANLINYEPKTVPSSRKYDIKLGGNLGGKVSKTPEMGGGVSAEISTSYKIDSVTTNASKGKSPSNVIWERQHDHGPAIGRNLGWNWPETTTSSVSETSWALYSFNRTINDGITPLMKVTVDLSGNFGSQVASEFPRRGTPVHPYNKSEMIAYFWVPTMNYDPVYTPENPLEIAPGHTVTVQIQAGVPATHNGHPVPEDKRLPLQWRPYDIPKDKDGREYLKLSPNESRLGDGPLKITATSYATPGLFGYIRLNSIPKTATDSLRQGGLDIPIKIV